jgi:hypothetical protein
MAGPSFQLVHIVSDLIRDPALRQQFNEDPVKVMDEYELTKAERLILLTMDRPGITAAVKQELDSFQVDKSEFPPCSEEYLPELGQAPPEYPDPVPAILRFRPLKVKKNALPFELIVTGQSFSRSPDAIVKVTEKANSSNTLAVSSTLFGTFRCSRLRAVVAPKGAALTIPVGKYKVEVDNNPGTANAKTLTASLDLEVEA